MSCRGARAPRPRPSPAAASTAHSRCPVRSSTCVLSNGSRFVPVDTTSNPWSRSVSAARRASPRTFVALSTSTVMRVPVAHLGSGAAPRTRRWHRAGHPFRAWLTVDAAIAHDPGGHRRRAPARLPRSSATRLFTARSPRAPQSRGGAARRMPPSGRAACARRRGRLASKSLGHARRERRALLAIELSSGLEEIGHVERASRCDPNARCRRCARKSPRARRCGARRLRASRAAAAGPCSSDAGQSRCGTIARSSASPASRSASCQRVASLHASRSSRSTRIASPTTAPAR